MDDGELDTSEDPLSPNLNSSTNFHGPMSLDSFIDDLLKNARTCTHTHTCNPPGPDSTHTHTCYHTHTQVLASEDDDHPTSKQNSTSKSRRPSGNRDAVRKYREKKKAHAAYLEEEVNKLRLANQQLARKLRRQAVLEAEVLRLRGLLVDLRGKIDSTLGTFPFQKQSNTTSFFKEADCQVQPSAAGVIGLQCQTDSPCFHPHIGLSSQISTGGISGPWKVNCQPAIVDCQANENEIPSGDAQAMDTMETLVSSATQGE